MGTTLKQSADSAPDSAKAHASSGDRDQQFYAKISFASAAVSCDLAYSFIADMPLPFGYYGVLVLAAMLCITVGVLLVSTIGLAVRSNSAMTLLPVLMAIMFVAGILLFSYRFHSFSNRELELNPIQISREMLSRSNNQK
jgi:hypothetical protein